MKTGLARPGPKAGAWVGTLLYCGLSFPFFLFALLVGKNIVMIAITGFFAAIGVIFLVATIRMSLGSAAPEDLLRLRVENPRPAPGGRLAAVVFLPKTGRYATVAAELSCWRIDAHSKPVEVLWSGRQSVKAQPNVRGAIAKIAIDIPAGLQPTALPGSSRGDAGAQQGVKWELRLSALGHSFEQESSYQVLVVAALGPGEEAAAEPAMPPPGISSLWVLVAANLVPIAGAVFWDWQVRDVVYLYWIENLVVGAFAILRILAGTPDAMQMFAGSGAFRDAAPGSRLLLGKLAVIVLFLLHYGAFCVGHRVFLGALFPAPPGAASHTALGSLTGLPLDRNALVAIAAIAASHAYSFLRNYLGRGEYRHPDFGEIMTQPYKRIFITQMFILAGGFLVQAFNLPLAALVVFVGLKIAFDGYFHRAERKALAPKAS